jgi:hypothetical protein
MHMVKIAANRWLIQGPNGYQQEPNSATCDPTSIMNVARKIRGRPFKHPNMVLRMLDFVGPTTQEGTTDAGTMRQAHALGLGAVPLRRNVAAARRIINRGGGAVAAINPANLPMGLQVLQGGPFMDGGHEVEVEWIGPFGGAVIKDPEPRPGTPGFKHFALRSWAQPNRYFLGPRQFRRAMGVQGGLHGLWRRW